MSVVYQIYVRSFADSNGDGVGDLPGVSRGSTTCDWLGIDTLWLSPTFPSPNVDWGYDVSDYLDVHPELGTLADLDALIAGRAPAASTSGSTSSRTTPQTGTRGSRIAPSSTSGPTISRTTGDPSSRAAPRGTTTRGASATTCTSSPPSSPISTGGTPTSATSSIASSASGSTAASPASHRRRARADQRPRAARRSRYMRERPEVHDDLRTLAGGRTRVRPEADADGRDLRAAVDSSPHTSSTSTSRRTSRS